MIELKELRKSYKTGDFIQRALDGVTLNLRDNEFVAILGQSGSGKTTLLNVLGGLDHADSGDIVVNGTSTKDYTAKDWDTYRNHRIGFIFQSYNLIPHQTVLANVELALTLSGVGRSECRTRAIKALEEVGLGDHINKKPSQLSGGQMQRVAIARALVNDPEIVLADEPTGALDTETGIQVMNILKSVANDRLVVMVTHNPELAEEYATRIVRLADGRIIDDNDPFDPAHDAAMERAVSAQAAEAALAAAAFSAGSTAKMPTVDNAGGADAADAAGASAPIDAREAAKGKKASMSFLTALGLSFNNLMTKKGRTFLTAFAGSIGIIGIAAILALSNGTNNYIAQTEEEALTSYPLTITKSSFDITSLMTANYMSSGDSGENTDKSIIPETTIMSDMFAKVKNNDLEAFKSYLDSGESGIEEYVNTIDYDYGITPLVYKSDTSDGVVQLNPSSMSSVFSNGLSSSSLLSSSMSMSAFQQMIDNPEVIASQVEVVAGRMPENYDEAILVLTSEGTISDYTLYSLGVHDPNDMTTMIKQALNGEEVTVPKTDTTFSYEDALNLTFKVVPSTSLYSYNADQDVWTDHSSDEEYMTEQVENGITLKIVGVVKHSENSMLSAGVAYLPSLTRKLIDIAADSDIVKQQLANEDVDVFTGETFEDLQDDNAGFDMSSMFSIDTSALSNMFSFGSSSSSSTSSSSSFNFDASTLSNIDLSNIDFSALTNVFNAESISKIVTGAPTPDYSKISTDVSQEQLQAITEATTNMTTGYFAFIVSHYSDYLSTSGLDLSKAYNDYLATDEGKQAQAALRVAGGEIYDGTVGPMVDDYMENKLTPYIGTQMQSLMSQAAQAVSKQIGAAISDQLSDAMKSMANAMSSAYSFDMSAFTIDTDAFANAFSFNMTQEDLTSLLTSYMSSDEVTLDSNLEKLGYADLSKPSSISIYPKDFAAKEKVIDVIDAYNKKMTDEGNDNATIQYSDIAGALMSSVTNIVDMISLVLIAFVSISLVVSSIMIAIITYISVLERKKEIGILRAMGASKLNVANVFNAETIIEGLIAGVFAILVVLIASIPVNLIVEAWQNVPNIMALPWDNALVLILISVVLTFVAGLIPSSMASNRDPVEALRSE